MEIQQTAMDISIDDKLLSVLEDLPLKIKECTVFADIMSTYGLIPNEVRDDVYSFIEIEDYTDEFLNSYILQAFKDCLTTNGQEELVQQLVMLLEKYKNVLNIGNIPQMKKKTLLDHHLWSREVEMHMRFRMDVDEEEEENMEENEIPEGEINLINDEEAIETEGSSVETMDENTRRSIIGIFEEHYYNIAKCMENEPDRFADYLCSQAMIPASLRNDIHTAASLSSFDKASKILQEVQRRIEFNPLHCLKFVMLMIHYDDDSVLSSYGKTIKHLLEKQDVWFEQVERDLIKKIIPICEIASSSPIQQYKAFLKSCYDKPFPEYGKFPTIRNSKGAKQYINLALVQECHNKDITKESLFLQLRGNVDEIKKIKTPIAIHKVGVLPDHTVPRFILVQGGPGVGKTTLAWELCHQWSEGKVLQKWEIVVFVQLRNQYIRCAESLEQLLRHPYADTCRKVCEQLQQTLGEGVMLVLDGFDELSEQQRTGMPLITQFLNGDILPNATFLITSRPLATVGLSQLLRREPDQHIEVIGFSENDIEAFVNSVFSHNPQLCDNFQTYIKSYPFAYSIMYIPLHCRIITEVYETYWKEGRSEFAPKTVTQLYKSLLRSLLMRYLGDLPDYKYRRISLEKFEQLPGNIYSTLMTFAKLAAKGIEERQYVFNELPLSEHMGLMIQVEDVYVDVGSCVSYSFLHLTLQEFLAAVHWSQLSADELTNVLQQTDLFPLSNFIDKKSINIFSKPSRGYNTPHWPILIFLAGIGGICSNIIADNISSYIKHSRGVIIYPNICKLLYETQSPQLIANVLHNGLCHLQTRDNHLLQTHSMLECFEIGYCIACSGMGCTWGINGLTESKCVKTFTLGLKEGSTVSVGGGQLNSLQVYFDKKVSVYEQEHFVCNLSSCFSQAQSLDHFAITQCRFAINSFLPFEIATLITPPFSNLSELSLTVDTPFITWIPVISALPKMSNLKFLCLSTLFISTKEIYFVCDSLKKCKSLVQLVLNHSPYTGYTLSSRQEDQLFPIVALPLLTQLHFLTLACMKLDGTISLLSSALQSSSCKLNCLNITGCILTFESMVMLIRSLKRNCGIQKLRIIACKNTIAPQTKEDYTQDLCFVLTDLLSYNSHIIEIVHFPFSSDFNITRDGLISLVQAIESRSERKLITNIEYQKMLNGSKYSAKQVIFESRTDILQCPKESLHEQYRLEADERIIDCHCHEVQMTQIRTIGIQLSTRRRKSTK